MTAVVTLAALDGCERQPALHIKVALDVGAGPGKIVEILVHQSACAEIPRALDSVTVARAVFAERGVSHGAC